LNVGKEDIELDGYLMEDYKKKVVAVRRDN
jgi:hypothetical protein